MTRPNDRLPDLNADGEEDPDPQIYLIIDQKKFLRPGLETYYANPAVDNGKGIVLSNTCSCNPVGGVYCACNSVCTCNPQCTCQSNVKKTCSCQGHRSSSGGRYCSCVPVH